MSSPTGVTAALQALLSQLFPDLAAAGPDVTAYLAAGLAEEDDPDADELGDSLSGFCPSFGTLPAAEQRRTVDDLLQRVAALRAERSPAAVAPATAAAAAPSSQPQQPLAVVMAQTLARLSSLSVEGYGSSSSSVHASEDESEGGAAAWTPEQQAAISTLGELCALPDASDAFLAHVLASKGGGSVEAAATWMLECPDLAAAQEAWRQAQQRRQEERARAAAERAAAKKQIVSRFHLQAVPNGSSGGGKSKPEAVKAWGMEGKGTGSIEQSKVRYRDGMVATRAGQKYVIEKQGEEWDGGSRGKVYTKGKRGKGFV